MMRRREFITLLGGAAAWPLAASAQQGDRVRRIGVLMAYDENDALAKTLFSTFIQALAGLGWTVGSNVSIDLRWAGGDINRIRLPAQELVGLQPDNHSDRLNPRDSCPPAGDADDPDRLCGRDRPRRQQHRPAGVPEAAGRPAGLALRLPRRQDQRSCAMHPVVTVTGGSEEGSGAAPRRPPPHWLAGQNRTKSRSMGQYECAAPSRSVDAPRGTRVN